MKKDNDDFGNYFSNLGFLLDNNLIKKIDKILEIGSGKGHMLNTLKQRGFNIIGVERFQGYIDEAKKVYWERIPLNKVEDENLPFLNNSFDKVISFDVLEHIPDTDMHLQEVRRVLKDGGEYCFCVPNRLINAPFLYIVAKKD